MVPFYEQAAQELPTDNCGRGGQEATGLPRTFDGTQRASGLGEVGPHGRAHLHHARGRVATLGAPGDRRHLPQVPLDREGPLLPQ